MAAFIKKHRDTDPPSSGGGDPSSYFNSYNDVSVHELMLKDRPRTLAYRNFFETHRDLVKDKVVMDVGAGTGILSLFAATAGARKVFAVEASDVASLCQEIVEENGLQGTIEVIHGAVEDIQLDTKVDVIVSEWMGFYLLHESMLDSVIVARDRFLAPGGIMAPSHASIFFAPVDMSEHFQERADEWSNIYGFDFSPIASAMNVSEVSQPLVQCLQPAVLRADPEKLLSFDLKTVTQEDVSRFTERVQFCVSEDTRVHGFACWFDVYFSGADGVGDGVNVDANVESVKDGVDAGGGDGVGDGVDVYVGSDVGSRSATSPPQTLCKMDERGDRAAACQGTTSSTSSSSSHTSNASTLKAGDASTCSVGDTSSGTKRSRGESTSIVNEASGSSCEASSTTAIPGRSSAVSTSSTTTTKSPPPLALKTGPGDPPTHWKQTVIFLPQTIFVGAGVDLCCKVTMAQDVTSNKRHYNITVALTDEAGGDSEDDDDDDNAGYFAGGGSGGSGEDDDVDEEEESESARRQLLSALVEKYRAEHDQLGDEAELVEVKAEMEAARQLNEDIEKEGWPMDTSISDTAAASGNDTN